MTILAEHIVLRFHDTRQCAHQHPTLAGEVAENFVLEVGRKEIAGPDADAHRKAAFFSTTRRILPHRIAGVDACSERFGHFGAA